MPTDETNDMKDDGDSSTRAPKLRVDDVVWREVGGDLVVLELSTSTYLTLNGSARQLWLALAEGKGQAELEECLTTTYGISEAQAATDTVAFLADLGARKLLASD